MGLIISGMWPKRCAPSVSSWRTSSIAVSAKKTVVGPEPSQDVAAAARFVVDNADEWHLDPTRLIALGHSAGGHLALWLAGQSGFRMKVQFPVMVSTSLGWCHWAVSRISLMSMNGVWVTMLFVDCLVATTAAFPDRYRAASPAELLPMDVPQLLVHGEDDEDVPIEHARLYLKKRRRPVIRSMRSSYRKRGISRLLIRPARCGRGCWLQFSPWFQNTIRTNKLPVSGTVNLGE